MRIANFLLTIMAAHTLAVPLTQLSAAGSTLESQFIYEICNASIQLIDATSKGAVELSEGTSQVKRQILTVNNSTASLKLNVSIQPSTTTIIQISGGVFPSEASDVALLTQPVEFTTSLPIILRIACLSSSVFSETDTALQIATSENIRHFLDQVAEKSSKGVGPEFQAFDPDEFSAFGIWDMCRPENCGELEIRPQGKPSQ